MPEADPRAELAALAHTFYRRGWMDAGAGNLSARADAQSCWITASGKPKGELGVDDFVRVALNDGAVLARGRPEDQPSAETAIHRVVYRLIPESRACLHVHSLAASVVSLAQPADAGGLPLPALEILKGLGIWDAAPAVSLWLLDNDPDVARIAQNLAQRLAHEGAPRVPGILVRGHGITTWGASINETRTRVEALEFILNYLAHGLRAGSAPPGSMV